MSKATLSLLTAREGRPFTVRTELQGEALLLRMPARSAAILRRLDALDVQRMRERADGSSAVASEPSGGGAPASSTQRTTAYGRACCTTTRSSRRAKRPSSPWSSCTPCAASAIFSAADTASLHTATSVVQFRQKREVEQLSCAHYALSNVP